MDDLRTVGLIVVAVLMVAVILFGVVGFTVRNITIHYDRAACGAFADKTSRETKFVSYTYWSWDCLTPSGDGKWISTANLREFGDSR